MSTTRERAEQLLAMAELEEELLAAKEDDDPERLRKAKVELRAARAAQRAGATTTPETIGSSASGEQPNVAADDSVEG